MSTHTFLRRRASLGFITQGVAAAVGAALITFRRDHSLAAGSQALAVTWILLLIGQVIVTVSWPTWSWGFRSGWLGVAVTAGAAAVMGWLGLSGSAPAAALFFATLGGWAGVTALVAIVMAWTQTDRSLTRDFVALGVMAALLAIIEVTVPLSDIYAVGISGAYLAIFAVYVIIAGVSVRLMPSPTPPQEQ